MYLLHNYTNWHCGYCKCANGLTVNSDVTAPGVFLIKSLRLTIQTMFYFANNSANILECESRKFIDILETGN